MATDFTIALEDRPGTLADLGEALGGAGVNIGGLCGFPSEGVGIIHVLVDDADAARRALTDAGLDVRDEREVVVVDCPDEPGAFGRRARRIADAGANIDLAYLATGTRLVFGGDDATAIRAALSGA